MGFFDIIKGYVTEKVEYVTEKFEPVTEYVAEKATQIYTPPVVTGETTVSISQAQRDRERRAAAAQAEIERQQALSASQKEADEAKRQAQIKSKADAARKRRARKADVTVIVEKVTDIKEKAIDVISDVDVKVDKFLKEKLAEPIGDPLGLRGRQLPITLPFYGAPEEQKEMAEWQVEQAPSAIKESALTLGLGYGFGAAAKVGVIATTAGVTKVTKKMLDIGIVPKVTELAGKKVGKGVGTALHYAPGVVEPTTGAIFAITASEEIKKQYELAETPAERARVLSTAAVGLFGAEKGYRAPVKAIDIFRTLGKTELKAADIMEQRVLAGQDPFALMKPKETVPELITSFKEPSFKMPKDIPGYEAIHATGAPLPKDVTIGGIPTRPTDMPGLYVAPMGRGSAHFLRTGEIKPPSQIKTSPLESIFGGQESLKPTAVVVRGVKDVVPLPKRAMESLGAAKKHMVESAPKGQLTVTRDVMLAAGRKPVEAEAVLTPGTRMIKETTKYFTKIGRRRIPIDEYIIKDVAGKPPKVSKYIPSKVSKYVPPKISKYIPPKPSRVILPIESRFIPKPSKRIVPSERIIPSERIVPSERIIPSERITPTEREPIRSVEESRVHIPPFDKSILPVKRKKAKKELKKRKGKIDEDFYAWQLVNPMATIEQMMMGKMGK